jgi:Asp-tRNA(Asn)/Glu-tRNA(Gln) amidotransferase A subunit family amidase
LKRDGIDTEVLAAYDCSAEALGELGAEIVMYRCLPGLRISARSMVVSCRLKRMPRWRGWLTKNAQPLDQGVRPRVRDGAVISSRDYLVALAERERMKASFSSAIEGIVATGRGGGTAVGVSSASLASGSQ